MAKVKEQMHRLLVERQKLAAQLEEVQRQAAGLEHELAGLDRAIRVMKGDPLLPAGVAAPATRVRIKDGILGLLAEYASGLTAAEAVEFARKRGMTFDRASVSSILSRLKREGTLEIEGSKYRIAKREKANASGSSLTVN
jgi:prefoldin subunit 5